MFTTPKGLRLQIGGFGLRNAGKSSLLNRISGQQVSIVSDIPGTTTDPVEKAMEFPPLGPVLFIDTAGLDDEGELGGRRIGKSRQVMERTDLALIVSGTGVWSPVEWELAEDFLDRKIPVLAVFNKSDIIKPSDKLLRQLESKKIPWIPVSAKTGGGIARLRSAILAAAPQEFLESSGMLPDTVGKDNFVLLVTPVDLEAPKGRLILPQVQAIRDALDKGSWCIVVKENRLTDALNTLVKPPALVITDSQAFATVSKLVPETIPLTSFSILLARQKTDLAVCAAGAAAIDRLQDGDKVLIAEACTHHPIGEDIGTVKIPALLKKKTGKQLITDHCSGHDFPSNLTDYSLVIHCGGCMFNRREILTRTEYCMSLGVPFTNYGVAIAHCTGILERALKPFPGVYEAYRKQH